MTHWIVLFILIAAQCATSVVVGTFVQTTSNLSLGTLIINNEVSFFSHSFEIERLIDLIQWFVYVSNSYDFQNTTQKDLLFK